MAPNARKLLLTFTLAVIATACSSDAGPTASNVSEVREAKKELSELRGAIKKIEPFFEPMGEPGPSDWLAANREPGQTFGEYIDSDPTLPTEERKVIYVQPLGKFDSGQKRVIKITSEYIEAFFGLPVRSLSETAIPGTLPSKDYRTIDYPKHRQIRSGYILEKILQPALPKDAAALIGFTNEDLYPDTTMYFVFGQASLENRVGVWSLFRLDDQADFQKFLARTMKIAVHETGHMFSMRHCTKYECVMSGSNHLGETDRRPIDACPECMAKICWMRKEQPAERYKRLVAFANKNALKMDAGEFSRKLKAVETDLSR